MNNKKCTEFQKELLSETSLAMISKPSSLTDETLYSLCKTYGERVRLWRQKFAGLLPEVFKRRLYEKKGFSSIYEFAAKLAGMSHEQVDMVLRLERKFEDKPILQKALVEGEISANKLVRVASIATTENQEEIFEKTKMLSKRAIEVFVRDVKNAQKNEEKNQSLNENDNNLYGILDENLNKNSNKNLIRDGSNRPLFDLKSLPGQTFESGLKLDPDVENELIKMQEKEIDINEFLREALKKRKEEIENEKTKIAEAQKLEQEERELIGMIPGKYMRINVKKIIREEHGTKCSVPGCNKPAKTLHHTGRFALMKNHDPHFIAPLCEGHHELAHKIDLKYFENWSTAMK